MRIQLVLLLVFCAVAAGAQSLNQKRSQTATVQPQAAPVEKPPLSAASQHYLRKYSTASRWNDMGVAVDALYDLIVGNPANDSLIFTLGYFYFQNQRYASSLIIA